MKEELFKIINKYFPNNDQDKNNWNYIINNSSSAPSILYLQSMVEYYVAYYTSNQSINLSFVFYDDRNPVGIMPLMIHKKSDHKWLISCNGAEIIEPIFIKLLAPKLKKKLENNLKDLIIDIAKHLNIHQFDFVNMNVFELSDWYLMWAGIADEVFSTHHKFVDLSLSLQEIYSGFRKSFRPLVNKGRREFNIQAYEKISDELFDSFKLLHEKAAGKITRPNESWNIQKSQIHKGEAFLITVGLKGGHMTGGGLFHYTNDLGFYSVGAYDREFSDEPLGHAVQMKAIEIFKKINVKLYEIGRKFLKIKKKKPTGKELNISHFTDGFATQFMARQHLIVNF